jgi:hypothetical protein
MILHDLTSCQVDLSLIVILYSCQFIMYASGHNELSASASNVPVQQRLFFICDNLATVCNN